MNEATVCELRERARAARVNVAEHAAHYTAIASEGLDNGFERSPEWREWRQLWAAVTAAEEAQKRYDAALCEWLEGEEVKNEREACERYGVNSLSDALDLQAREYWG